MIESSALKNDDMIEMYRKMLQIRYYEDEIYYLFLQGLMPGTIHQCQGQEAVSVGVCTNLREEDYITTTHRPAGDCIAKGVSIRDIMAEMFAKTTGCCKAKGGAMHLGDIDVGVLPAIAIVGAGIPIAAGVGISLKMKKTDNVVVSFFGDGAANEGAFHEGVNLASVLNLPVVFVCHNNLYGASTHISKVMKVKDIAERASAYGIPGVVVDGNDVLAVYEVTGEAVKRAREGEGPTLVECKTYRRGGHSRGDPGHYRPKEEVEQWLEKDPISRFRTKLIEMEVLTEKKEDEIKDAISYARSCPDPKPEDALKYLYWEGGEEA